MQQRLPCIPCNTRVPRPRFLHCPRRHRRAIFAKSCLSNCILERGWNVGNFGRGRSEGVGGRRVVFLSLTSVSWDPGASPGELSKRAAWLSSPSLISPMAWSMSVFSDCCCWLDCLFCPWAASHSLSHSPNASLLQFPFSPMSSPPMHVGTCCSMYWCMSIVRKCLRPSGTPAIVCCLFDRRCIYGLRSSVLGWLFVP
eukprot:1207850-Pyramimonas_sp.AAC.1